MMTTAEPGRDATPLIGEVLPGQFRVDAQIAAGSFGAVYRARQLTVGRDVAIKVMKARVSAVSEDGRLFVQEIQTLARIDHRNVVRVHQADVTGDGQLFLAMELLAGRDLQTVLAERTVDAARAVAWIQQLLTALGAVHRAGIVHADVKPGNVILTEDRDGERLVLVDFGFARLRQLDAYADSIGGTPAFMAPEQLRAGRVDARSDQFSAALVLVMLLTGWARRRPSELAPPDQVLAQIDDEQVRQALHRALAIEPDQRFPSVSELAAALSGDLVAPPSRPPFHGLAAFTEDDRGRLYGRDRELARLVELVLYRPLVIVTAPSGVGKTRCCARGSFHASRPCAAKPTTCRVAAAMQASSPQRWLGAPRTRRTRAALPTAPAGARSSSIRSRQRSRAASPVASRRAAPRACSTQ